jgi:hypothetical protein
VQQLSLLRLTIQLSLQGPDHSRCLQAYRQSPSPPRALAEMRRVRRQGGPDPQVLHRAERITWLHEAAPEVAKLRSAELMELWTGEFN